MYLVPVSVLRLLQLPAALPGPEVARVVPPVRARVHVHADEVVLDGHRVGAPLKHAAPLRQRHDLVRANLSSLSQDWHKKEADLTIYRMTTGHPEKVCIFC